jgi:UDP-N-acetylmuramate--alanine ligase
MYKYLIRGEASDILSRFNSFLGYEKISEVLKNKDAKIHFVGIGGVGMYSLAVLCRNMGLQISGSDREHSPRLSSLEKMGCKIYNCHKSENAVGCNAVAYTLAAADDNPELLYAESAGLPCISRAELLGALMQGFTHRIGVSGSHGKSTVTAMLDCIFYRAGLNPTTLSGASLFNMNEPLRLGGREYFIYEGCEYKDSFLRMAPTAAVFTNLELDHPDYFKDLETIKQSFLRAMEIPQVAFVNVDDENLRSLIPCAKAEILTYGERDDADFRAAVKKGEFGCYKVKIRHGCRDIIDISLKIPGKFNALNATAAAAAAFRYGISPECIGSALSSFQGIERRMQPLFSARGCSVIYDYAHHPTEIRETLLALRQAYKGRITVVFAPHTYSRTGRLMQEFKDALSLADSVRLCEISAIREEPIPGVSSEALCKLIGSRAGLFSLKEIPELLSYSNGGALVLMGAASLDGVRAAVCKYRDK